MNNFSIYDLQRNRPSLLVWSKGMTDADLVRHTIEGNNDGFSVLMHRYYKLIRYSVSLVIWRDEEVQNDAMQDAVIKILEFIKAGKYNFSYQRFDAMAYYYARYAALAKFYKSKYVSAFLSMDELTQEYIDLRFSIPADQETKLIKEETKKELRHYIGRLPKAQKEVIILSEFFQMSYTDIAKLKNRDSTTVSIQQGKAMQFLRVAMGSTYRQPLCSREALGAFTVEEKQEQQKAQKPISRMAAAMQRLREKRLAEEKQRAATA